MLPVGLVGEVAAKDVVAEHQQEVTVDVGFGLEDSVGQTELLTLLRVGDRGVATGVAVAINDLFGLELQEILLLFQHVTVSGRVHTPFRRPC